MQTYETCLAEMADISAQAQSGEHAAQSKHALYRMAQQINRHYAIIACHRSRTDWPVQIMQPRARFTEP